MKNKKLFRLLEFVGSLLLITSIILACFYHYKHFYELLIVGLFLIFFVLDYKLLRTPIYTRLYKKFFIAGLLGDFVLGITVTKLWFYNYHSIIEYVSLYVVIYPIAGIVMLQTYLFFAKKLISKKGIRYFLQTNDYTRLNNGMAGICLGLAVAVAITKNNHLLLLIFFWAASAWGLLVLAYATHIHHQKNILDQFISHPFGVIVVVILSTYINAFLHELPNTAAHQWVYTNWPMMNITVGKVPLAVLLAWPVLTLYPASAYYYVLATSKQSAKKNLPATKIRSRSPRLRSAH